MKRYIFTSLAPNIEFDDIIRSLWLFFTLQRKSEKQAISLLIHSIQEFFNTKHVFLFESGRSALAALLMVLKMRPGDEVLLQAYTCVAVPNAVLWAGGKPVYVDCEAQSLTMSAQDLEKKITSRSRALIIQHTFGIAADMDALCAIAKRHSLLIIEDCAHTIGGEYREKKLGTFGDASILSFGRDKPISSVFGGSALVYDSTLAKEVNSFFLTLKNPSWFWTQRQLVQPFLTSFAKATFFIGFGKLLLYVSLLIHLIYPAITKKERQGEKPCFVFHTMPPALATLALRQWKKLERFNAHRQTLSNMYSNALRGMSGLRLLEPGAERNTIFLRYPVFVEDARGALSFARKHGIYLGDWYNSPVAPADAALFKVMYSRGFCPVSERVSAETINLPTSIDVSKDSARRVIVCVKSYLDSLRRTE